jgi:enhancing lycopene biosynthesis protein 2
LVCGHAARHTAQGHGHDDHTSSVRIHAHGHSCTHAPEVVALRSSFGGNQSPATYAPIAPAVFRASFSAVPDTTVTDAGPPGFARLLSFGSTLPLRI